MADAVRFSLEKMVPELSELEEAGYFNKEEIKQIVKRREEIEYSLKRSPPTLEDFKSGVGYEKSLLLTMKYRKQQRGISDTKGPANASILKRCHELYERACTIYKGDLHMWLEWLNFCKESQSTRRISKVLAQALQIHPKAHGLWTYSARWEFEDNKNPTAARTLMQQGLRICNQNQDLWIDYLKMELVYAQKLATRRAILGIQSQSQPQEAKGAQPATTQTTATPDADPAVASSTPAYSSAPSHGHTKLTPDLENLPAEPTEQAMEAVVSGAIARIVVKEALEQIKSLDFYRKVVYALEDYRIASTDSILEDVDDAMESLIPPEGDAKGKEGMWEERARKLDKSAPQDSKVEKRASVKRVQKVYEKAISDAPSMRMFALYLAFLEEKMMRASSKAHDHALRWSMKGNRKKVAKQMLAVLQKAQEKGALTEEAALKWPKLLIKFGDVIGALLVAERNTGMFAASSAVWAQRLSLLAQHVQFKEGEERIESGKTFMDISQTALNSVTALNNAQDPGLWMRITELTVQLGLPLSHLLEQLNLLLSTSPKGPVKGGMGEVAAKLLEVTWYTQGQQDGRDLYSRLLKLPAAGGDFFNVILDLELASEEDKLDEAQMRVLFETAVSTYGSEDTRLWLKYVKYMGTQGKASGHVVWRAGKELKSADEFFEGMGM